MSDQYLAEIRTFACTFAPLGWALCQGQIMPIAQNTALFSLLGTNFGGDGRSTFGLPNLQGAVAVNQGQGPGLSPYTVGQTGGTANVTLTSSEMPSHTHGFNASTAVATSASPASNVFETGHYEGGRIRAYSAQPPQTALAPTAIAPSGGGQPHNNMMPYLTMNYCIALQGEFPPRS